MNRIEFIVDINIVFNNYYQKYSNTKYFYNMFI